MPSTLELPVIRLSDHPSRRSTEGPPANETPENVSAHDDPMDEREELRPAGPDQTASPPVTGPHGHVESLLEYANSLGLRPQVNLDAGVITGVKVLGHASRNSRVYRAAAMAAAVPLYEGVKVNVNHPKSGAAAPRDYQDRLGCLRNVRAAEGGLFGDLHFNPRHPLAGQLAWDAQWAPENVGLSHNVQARTSTLAGQTIVEQILRVNSVDLVADPATTHGLFESANEASPPLAAAPKPPNDAPPGDNGLPEAALREAKQQLLERRRRIDALLREVRLPSEAASAAFVEQLASVEEDAARGLIQERAQFYRSLTAAGAKPKSKGPVPEAADSRGDVRRWARLIT